MVRKAGVAAVALVLAVGIVSPAQAIVAAAAPGSFAAGWATPVIVTPVGGPVTVISADVAPHQLIAEGAFLPKKKAKRLSWCKGFSAKRCPLFWSERIGTGETTRIEGLQFIRPGEQYPFVCAVHPNMTGLLVGI